QRLGLETLQALLPSAPAVAEAPHGNGAVPNGKGIAEENRVLAATIHASTVATDKQNGSATVAGPVTQAVPRHLPEPSAGAAPEGVGGRAICSETFLAGSRGEELRDYAFCYNSDGSIRETVVYFYGADQRAATAHRQEPLWREAVYLGRVDPVRLHEARKLT